ncbi:limonene-1,2-epoxide hydrolase [Mycobacterium haemophilum DSM 44634]
MKRLKVGLEPLARYQNHDGLLVCNGVNAIYGHSETWHWNTGETAVLQFVSVHRVWSKAAVRRSRSGRTIGIWPA